MPLYILHLSEMKVYGLWPKDILFLQETMKRRRHFQNMPATWSCVQAPKPIAAATVFIYVAINF